MKISKSNERRPHSQPPPQLTQTAPEVAPEIATEADLWAEVRRLIAGRPEWHGRRFEDRSQPGIPDAMLSGTTPGGRWYAWVELKVGRLRYERGQLPWALDAACAGEACLTLLWRGGGALLYDTAAVARARVFVQADPEPVFAGDLKGALVAIRQAAPGGHACAKSLG